VGEGGGERERERETAGYEANSSPTQHAAAVRVLASAITSAKATKSADRYPNPPTGITIYLFIRDIKPQNPQLLS